jgi:hypothetical protein
METQPHSLKLKNYETKTSRLILLKVTPEKAQAITSENCLTLGRSIRERRLWEQILEQDLIICIAFEGNNIRRFAYRALGKGLKLQRTVTLFPEENPFLIFVELIGIGVRSSIKGMLSSLMIFCRIRQDQFFRSCGKSVSQLLRKMR